MAGGRQKCSLSFLHQPFKQPCHAHLHASSIQAYHHFNESDIQCLHKLLPLRKGYSQQSLAVHHNYFSFLHNSLFSLELVNSLMLSFALFSMYLSLLQPQLCQPSKSPLQMFQSTRDPVFHLPKTIPLRKYRGSSHEIPALPTQCLAWLASQLLHLPSRFFSPFL